MNNNYFETDLSQLVKQMKLKEDINNKKHILNEILKAKTLTDKCILARYYLAPQSTDFEIICKKDLNIDKPLNSTSGDGRKNNINYEIKISVHSKNSKINFVQIRPDHNVHFYILIAYNMYDNSLNGKAYIFKIPSEKIYELIINYGGYAHGTCDALGKITAENIKGRNCEYALRCNIKSKDSKNHNLLWNEFMKYEVEYNSDNF